MVDSSTLLQVFFRRDNDDKVHSLKVQMKQQVKPLNGTAILMTVTAILKDE